MPKSTGRRSAFLDGYSLHADRLVDAGDRDGLERLCRYGARSPVANSRLSLDSSGGVVLSFKRPFHDGRAELAFAPFDFLRRLATLSSRRSRPEQPMRSANSNAPVERRGRLGGLLNFREHLR
jgi:hypothetical protein